MTENQARAGTTLPILIAFAAYLLATSTWPSLVGLIVAWVLFAVAYVIPIYTLFAWDREQRRRWEKEHEGTRE